MPKIININQTGVHSADITIAKDDKSTITVPLDSLSFKKPRVNQEVEVFSSGEKIIVVRPKRKINKKILILAGSAVAGIALIVCAIIFVPMMLDEDLRTPSTHPEYYKNMKEEKTAYAKALQICNQAATDQAKSKGKNVEYNSTNINAVYSRDFTTYKDPVMKTSGVYPTAGDIKGVGCEDSSYRYTGSCSRYSYKETDRYYDCETDVSGNTVTRMTVYGLDGDANQATQPSNQ